MEINFDPTKEAINISKHGISLAEATRLEWDSAMTWPDARRDYGEARMIGLALMGSRLYFVVFTDRDEERRIISLRKANDREVRRYVSEN
ncbi:MAG: BrnT family toxin [Proteobacteria bacterium]|nr:BrnT family toxin [Pseudomonadota bacterium]